jgi:predicted DNA-binding mobile mystery protein A
MRRQLDKQLEQLRPLISLERPPKGWLRAIREALGMTRKQLGRRMNITPQAVEEFEKHEDSYKVSLNTLQQAAKALNCKIFYVLIPEKPLEQTVNLQMKKKATEIVKHVSHSMCLEEQGTSQEEAQSQVLKVIDTIKSRKNISLIWEEEK